MLLSIPDPVNLSNGFSNIVGRVEPAVVNISTTEVFEEPKGARGAHGQDPFQDFFNKYFSQNPGAEQGAQAERSLGSGETRSRTSSTSISAKIRARSRERKRNAAWARARPVPGLLQQVFQPKSGRGAGSASGTQPGLGRDRGQERIRPDE